jgi:hypothetical protein|tara:strand:- start:162 stop:383 length:222 start_codon:yes stop_codon:yes gene_type:complete
MFVLLSGLLFAGDEQKVIYKEKTEIDFESVEIEGAVKKPNGQMILERVKAQFNPLLEIRDNFSYEIHESVKDI